MRIFRTRAIINAPATVVWETLTDTKAYPKFDPNCLKIEGEFLPGKNIIIYSKSYSKPRLKARISQFEPNESMVWEAGLPFNIFKNVRTFTIIAKDDQTTEFSMVEVFDGHLFALFAARIPDLDNAFNAFSKGLKRFIESRP